MPRSERLVSPVSSAELERRWGVVREAMVEHGVDVLVAENNNNSVGGYVQWLTGIPALQGTPMAVVFPLDEPMTVVTQGALDSKWEQGGVDHPLFHGVQRVLSSAYFPAVNYTQPYEGERLVRALEPYRRAHVGLVGPFQMLYATVEQVKSSLSDAEFEDATDLVDSVKVNKSAEEVEMIRAAAAIQDAAIKAAISAIEPGRTDRQIGVVARNLSTELGSDQGFVLCASSPIGTPAVFGQDYQQGRIIREGDAIALLVENSGPGGMWSEVGRTITVGPAPERILEDNAFAIEAQRFTLDCLVARMPSTQVWEAYNEFIVDHGWAPERRIHCHGQGYDLVERPLMRFDETLPLAETLNLACHPSCFNGLAFVSLTDGFLVTPSGWERLHKTDQRVFEL